MQVVLSIEELPEIGIEASGAFIIGYLNTARATLAEGDTTALAIVLPSAGTDHDDWRRALARDLARAHTPKRVNVVGASDEAAKSELLAYLRDAPGVTGQYLRTHE